MRVSKHQYFWFRAIWDLQEGCFRWSWLWFSDFTRSDPGQPSHPLAMSSHLIPHFTVTEQTENYTSLGSFELASQPLEPAQRMKHEHKRRERLEGESKQDHGGLRLVHSSCETAWWVTGLWVGLSVAHITNHSLWWVHSLFFKVHQVW